MGCFVLLIFNPTHYDTIELKMGKTKQPNIYSLNKSFAVIYVVFYRRKSIQYNLYCKNSVWINSDIIWRWINILKYFVFTNVVSLKLLMHQFITVMQQMKQSWHYSHDWQVKKCKILTITQHALSGYIKYSKYSWYDFSSFRWKWFKTFIWNHYCNTTFTV